MQVEPRGHRRARLPVGHPRQVVERLGDRLSAEERPAPFLQPPVAVLQRQVQHRTLLDPDAEDLPAGRDRERRRQHETALADLRWADEQAQPLGKQPRHREGQRREVLRIEPLAVPARRAGPSYPRNPRRRAPRRRRRAPARSRTLSLAVCRRSCSSPHVLVQQDHGPLGQRQQRVPRRGR